MSKKYAGFQLSKLRFYVSKAYAYGPEANALMHVLIHEEDVHPLQTKYRVTGAFKTDIGPESDFWNQDRDSPNVRAWCVKQATKLGLFEKLKEHVYEQNGRNRTK